ncbi:putative ribulose-bisphosphate carboxylase [Helianthus annuus]|nr:putative ribulose-bisphosphate carboxylase [Helianthus annuus]
MKKKKKKKKKKTIMVWPPLGLKKYETLSYLPPLTETQLAKEVDYLLRKKWVPCLEFELEHGFVYRENARSPGYYDGRYWTMWKLPMFGCTDSAQVMKELAECKKEYPQAWIRIIGFDNVRQVQYHCINTNEGSGYKHNVHKCVLQTLKECVCVFRTECSQSVSLSFCVHLSHCLTHCMGIYTPSHSRSDRRIR